ncbi:MAG TPA: peptidoglycan DD-metalloendopeptidase family protein [Candidatus Paceibacterota bacterium]|nr:peptidoglycan DD-metalloendopeptidase family protein [Candidatus Paceibacterota bacterium]
MQLHVSIYKKISSILLCGGIILSALPMQTVFAQGTEEQLRAQINEKSTEIEKLQKEIDEYSKLYNATAKQTQTLQTALKGLEISKKKLQTELTLTEKNIKIANSTIEELSIELEKTKKLIELNSEALKKSLVSINQDESESTIENFIKYDSLSSAWDSVMSLNRFQRMVKVGLVTAKDLSETLTKQKNDLDAERKKLLSYQSQLVDKKISVEDSQKEQDSLLSKTKNKQSEYESLLKEKQKQKDEFEKELFSYESALRIIIDPSSIPGERSGVLAWPLDNVFITQYFGKTVDSRRLYVSGTHNGVDFRAGIGTPVKTALSGVVWGTGNTDIARGCYSYGKWILIKHANGLTTIYGHLSQIKVAAGDKVITGDVIGYSGNTGYSTGPHLHFGVYATQGVIMEKYSQSKSCKTVVLPLADPKAYLNPMSYLPKSQ